MAKRHLLEAALAAAKTTVKIIETELASLDEDTEAGAKVYTLTEAAERRNLSENTLRSWAQSGRLPCRRGARRSYLVTDADIDAALAASPAAPAKQPRERTLTLCKPEDDDATERMIREGRLVVRSAK